jgi:predicted phage terminase large subunit-like protein
MNKNKQSIQWEILNYPAIRVDMDDQTDQRQMGDPLWPEKYNIDQLNEIKASIGPRAWSSLYQQSPVPDGGGLFNENMFRFGQLPGEYSYMFTTADTAYTEKEESDFTVFSTWGMFANQLYLIDVFKKQIKSSEIEAVIEPFIKQHMRYGYRGTYIEPKGHGIYLNQKLAQKGLMIPSESVIKEFYSDRKHDKVERANNVIPHLSSRYVIINENISIKEDLIREVLNFPKVKHDDFTDTLIDAVKLAYATPFSMFDVFKNMG